MHDAKVQAANIKKKDSSLKVREAPGRSTRHRTVQEQECVEDPLTTESARENDDEYGLMTAVEKIRTNADYVNGLK